MIVDCIRRGCRPENAAEVGGVTRMTLHNWMTKGEEDPEGECGVFRAEVLKARADAEATLVGIIELAAKRGSWKAATWLLERGGFEGWEPVAKPLGRPAGSKNKPKQSKLDEGLGRLKAV